MNIGPRFSCVAGSLLLISSLSAAELSLSVGVHDFVVSGIENDVAGDGIKSGTSHTLGINTAIYIQHTTQSDIHFLGKAEAFLDNDQDALDSDHLPVWFDFLLEVDGPLYRFNDNNSLQWYVRMDNRQNTVSCIEREVRQHLGLGYKYTSGGFKFNASAYAGFYYIEIDDDTPAARGYPRSTRLDDGEASNIVELEATYDIGRNWQLFVEGKHYAANTGMKTLEDNLQVRVSYKNADFLMDGASVHLKVKYTKYDFSRFNTESVPMLPWDNDTLIQAYVLLPLNVL